MRRNTKLNYDSLIIPLKDKKGDVKSLCIAIPFLRMGEYPVIADCKDPYAEGVAITLNNGVPIETVSKMLGHKSIKQTQLYAKILDRKISEDMKSLRKKLS